MIGRPLCRETKFHVQGNFVRRQLELGCSKFLARAILFGIFDSPSVSFVPRDGVELGDIPQLRINQFEVGFEGAYLRRHWEKIGDGNV